MFTGVLVLLERELPMVQLEKVRLAVSCRRRSNEMEKDDVSATLRHSLTFCGLVALIDLSTIIFSFSKNVFTMAGKRSLPSRLLEATTLLAVSWLWISSCMASAFVATRPIVSHTPTTTSKTSSASSSSSRLWAATDQSPAITLQGVSCTHNGGATWQLKDLSYVLQRGAKVALVGRNGTGKSTLLRILAEQCCLVDNTVDGAAASYKYSGVIEAPRNVRVAYVEQEPAMPDDVTVGDALLGLTSSTAESETGNNNTGKKSVYDVVRRYRRAIATAETDPERLSLAAAAMDTVSGWDVLTKAEEVATRLRVRHLQDEPLQKLSGGERKRVALAAALVQEPDVLLLDEPTNFLSLAGVQWLADLLADRTLTLLMVTHDRAFMSVCNCIVELDQGKMYEYEGSYQDYLMGKQERLALTDQAIQSAKAKYRLELDWMRRQPQARATKSKARIEAFYKLEKSTKPRPKEASLDLLQDASERRVGGKIVTMRNVNLQYGDRVMLQDFSYDFCKGDRICLAGANGVGKVRLSTTMSRTLSRIQKSDLVSRLCFWIARQRLYDS